MRIERCGTIRIRHVTHQSAARNATRIQRVCGNSVGCPSFARLDHEKDVGRLGLGVCRPGVVWVALEIDAVEVHVAVDVANRTDDDDARASAPRQRCMKTGCEVEVTERGHEHLRPPRALLDVLRGPRADFDITDCERDFRAGRSERSSGVQADTGGAASNDDPDALESHASHDLIGG